MTYGQLAEVAGMPRHARAVGDILHAFDLLYQGETDLRPLPYHQRCLALLNLLFSGQQRQIKYVESAVKNKRQLLQSLRDQSKEGVVFKHKDAPYTPGLPASGASQFKYKFYATGSFIVAGINTQRSVALRLVDGPTSLGNVTVPPNHDIPVVGAVVEVRYLYAYPDGGCLYQPVYLGQRDDIDSSECTADQLKFKA